jgi:N-acetylmuramoyl-L-alanine amidase
MRCFISAGHQERPLAADDDPGAVAGGEREDVLTWAIADEIALAMASCEPVLVPQATRHERIEWVNKWSRPGDLAVEVHLNAGPIAAYGCEVYYAGMSNRGRQLAAELHAGLVRIGRSPRGVKPDTQSQHSGGLDWCRQTKPWAALVEVCFLTHAEERKWLTHGGALAAGRALAAAVDRMP